MIILIYSNLRRLFDILGRKREVYYVKTTYKENAYLVEGYKVVEDGLFGLQILMVKVFLVC